MRRANLHGISYEITDKSPRDVVAQKIKEVIADDENDPFYVCDLSEILRNIAYWREELPRVDAHYAMKCNPDPMLLDVLASQGVGFDCASKEEMKTILGLGVPAHRIIYSNPYKQPSHLKYAAKHNVDHLVFDSESELYKIKSLYPNSKLVLRIKSPYTEDVEIWLSEKYGVKVEESEPLLELAKNLGLNVVGVSFHVGTGATDLTIYPKTIKRARKVVDIAAQVGYKMNLLDIGGGFLGRRTDPPVLKQIFASVRDSLDDYFPQEMGFKIIAEPGRYFASSCFTLAANVIGKRKVMKGSRYPTTEMMYVVNDGIHQSFNCVFEEGREVEPILLDQQKYKGKPLFKSIIWGQTCDSHDKVRDTIYLPELNDGDWLVFASMGAYSLSMENHFNGMPVPRRYYTVPENMASMLQQKKQSKM